MVSRLQLLVDRSLLTLENLTLHESVFSNLYDTLTALINSLEARDPYSRHHSIRVTHIAVNFAKHMHLAAELVDSLRLAGALHDIGKIGIPDAILLKPDILSPEEAEIIRQHSVIGDNIVAPLSLLPRKELLFYTIMKGGMGMGIPWDWQGRRFLSSPVLLRWQILMTPLPRIGLTGNAEVMKRPWPRLPLTPAASLIRIWLVLL